MICSLPSGECIRIFEEGNNTRASLSQHSGQTFSYVIVLDFESTCWKDDKHKPQEIIEFPAVLLNTRSGEIEEEFHHYVQPQESPRLSAFCTELTGITQDQVDNGIPIANCLSRFSNWLKKLNQEKGLVYNDTQAIGFRPCTFITWSDWDLAVCLFYECRRKQIRRPAELNAWIDLRATYRKFYARKPQGLNGALKDVGIQFEGREHSGLHDSRNTARLVWKMICDGCMLTITKTLPGSKLKAGVISGPALNVPSLRMTVMNQPRVSNFGTSGPRSSAPVISAPGSPAISSLRPSAPDISAPRSSTVISTLRSSTPVISAPRSLTVISKPLASVSSTPSISVPRSNIIATSIPRSSMAAFSAPRSPTPSVSIQSSSALAFSLPKSSANVISGPRSSAPALIAPRSSATATITPRSTTPAMIAPRSSSLALIAQRSSTPVTIAPRSSAPVMIAPESSALAMKAPRSSAPAISLPGPCTTNCVSHAAFSVRSNDQSIYTHSDSNVSGPGEALTHHSVSPRISATGSMPCVSLIRTPTITSHSPSARCSMSSVSTESNAVGPTLKNLIVPARNGCKLTQPPVISEKAGSIVRCGQPKPLVRSSQICGQAVYQSNSHNQVMHTSTLKVVTLASQSGSFVGKINQSENVIKNADKENPRSYSMNQSAFKVPTPPTGLRMRTVNTPLFSNLNSSSDSNSSCGDSPVFRTPSPLSTSGSSWPGSHMKATPPMCQCGRRATRKLVQSPGPNMGRSFFCCPKTRHGQKCGFFKWESQSPYQTITPITNIRARPKGTFISPPPQPNFNTPQSGSR